MSLLFFSHQNGDDITNGDAIVALFVKVFIINSYLKIFNICLGWWRLSINTLKLDKIHYVTKVTLRWWHKSLGLSHET